ncbi:hypothetical protein FACS1894120_6110 [Clostridia bacterium]|nr:hypothetical protein FACS1894120_6110 [Clostridia bacterium]
MEQLTEKANIQDYIGKVISEREIGKLFPDSEIVIDRIFWKEFPQADNALEPYGTVMFIGTHDEVQNFRNSPGWEKIVGPYTRMDGDNLHIQKFEEMLGGADAFIGGSSYCFTGVS